MYLRLSLTKNTGNIWKKNPVFQKLSTKLLSYFKYTTWPTVRRVRNREISLPHRFSLNLPAVLDLLFGVAHTHGLRCVSIPQRFKSTAVNSGQNITRFGHPNVGQSEQRRFLTKPREQTRPVSQIKRGVRFDRFSSAAKKRKCARLKYILKFKSVAYLCAETN